MEIDKIHMQLLVIPRRDLQEVSASAPFCKWSYRSPVGQSRGWLSLWVGHMSHAGDPDGHGLCTNYLVHSVSHHSHSK